MADLEKTKHGVRYLNTYLEMGFPRVLCDTAQNKKKLNIDNALKLHNEGVPYVEIAKILGFSETTIRTWLIEKNLKPNTKKPTPKRRETGGRFAHLK